MNSGCSEAYQVGKGATKHGPKLEGTAIACGEYRHVGVVGHRVQNEHGVLGHGVRACYHVNLLSIHVTPLFSQERVYLIGQRFISFVVETLHGLEAVMLWGEVNTHLQHTITQRQWSLSCCVIRQQVGQ